MPLRQTCRTVFSLLFLAIINPELAQAQVVPDATLPTDVKKSGNMNEINGGERIGNNLFHSFFAFTRIYLTVKGSNSKRASKADLSIVGSK